MNAATNAWATAEPTLPDSVRCMSKFLLNMLRIEYEKRQVQIANHNIADANSWLKEQIWKYMKGVYPFDHDCHSNETVYEWWTSLDQAHSNDAQPLVVCIQYQFTPTTC